MPLYRRARSPFWWATFVGTDGRRVRRSTGQTGRHEARIVEARLIADSAIARSPGGGWTCSQVFASYLTEVAARRQGVATMTAKLARMDAAWGALPVAELTPGMVMEHRARLVGGGMKPASTNHDVAYLRAALYHARDVHAQPVPLLPWRRLMTKADPHRTRFASREEYRRLLDAADPATRAVVAFAVATGLRRGNILALDWTQVDMDSGIATMVVKGGKAAQVRLTPATRALLGTLGERKGRVFDAVNFRRRWARAKAGAGLEDLRFHDLRHTFGSWARMAGADIADICEAMHHSSPAVTMRYAHVEPEHHVTAFERVAAFEAHSRSHTQKKRG